MPHLTLHLNGPFRAELGGSTLSGLRRRVQGMLAYLACQPGTRAAQQNTYRWSTDPATERVRTLKLATGAAEKVGDHVPTLTAIAGAYSQASPDKALPQSYLDRVVSIDPNNAWAWIGLGWLRGYTGGVDAGFEAFDRAERLSPLDPFTHQITFGRPALHYRWDDDPTTGLGLIEEGLRRHPGVVWP